MLVLYACLVYAPAAVAFVVVNIIAGRLVPRYGRRVLEVGAVVLACGYAATALVLLAGLPFTPAVVTPTLVLQSIGGGLVIAPSLGAVLARISAADAGLASGVLSSAQQVGAALGVAVVGLVFFSSTDAANALAMASLGTLAAAVLAVGLVFLLPRQPVRA